MAQSNQKTLEEMIRELPPLAKQEAEDFIFFLKQRYQKEKQKSSVKKLKLNWRSGLKDLRDQFTAVELQHKALEWWDEDVSR